MCLRLQLCLWGARANLHAKTSAAFSFSWTLKHCPLPFIYTIIFIFSLNAYLQGGLLKSSSSSFSVFSSINHLRNAPLHFNLCLLANKWLIKWSLSDRFRYQFEICFESNELAKFKIWHVDLNYVQTSWVVSIYILHKWDKKGYGNWKVGASWVQGCFSSSNMIFFLVLKIFRVFQYLGSYQRLPVY